MSDLDLVLARARRPGRFVATRKFSLARDKAIEKMRDYTLETDEQVALELIAAAVLGGARFVAVDVRPDRVTVGWVGGASVSLEQLERLLDFLFVDQAARATRHLHQLAIGVNALLHDGPGEVTLESGDGATAARLILNRSGAARLGPADPFSGTYVTSATRRGWFGSRGPKPQPVYELLIERCRWCPIPLLFNDGAVFGYTGRTPPPPLGPRRVQVLPPQTQRVAPPGAPAPTLTLVVGGVIVREEARSRWVGQARMTVLDDGLRKTADMGSIVEDEAWAEMLTATRPLLDRVHAERGVAWKRPPLPLVRRPKAHGEPQRAITPPSERLTQVGLRRTLPLGELLAMPAGAPVFWVTVSGAESFGAQLAPHRFPWRILVLAPDEAEALDAMDLPVTLARLSGPADIGFVRGVLERGGGDRRVTVELEGARAVVHLPASPPHAWDPPEPGDPIGLVVGDTLTALHGSPVDLGGCAVEIHVRSETPPPRSALVALALTAVGRAATHDPALAAHLILAYALPHLYHDGGRVQLDVTWPEGWGPAREALLDTPLNQGEPPLTLRRWCRALAEGSAFPVPDRGPLLALEERLGTGALVGPTPGDPLAMAVRTPGGWRTLRIGDAPPTHTAEIVALYPTVALPPPPPGMVAVPMAIPGLSRFVLSDGEPAPGAGRAAFGAIELAIEGATGRDRAWLTLAATRLAVDLGRETSWSLPLAPHGRIRLSALLEDTPPTVGARGGVGVDLPRWLPVDLGLARVLEEARGERLPLVLDDPPALWESPAPEPWLLRVPVEGASVRGWLGLRRPFDPTPGIFKVEGTITSLWTELVHRIPAHGVVRISPAARDVALADAVLAGLRLFSALRDGLVAGAFVGDDLVAARAHAYAAAQQAARLGLDSTILKDLANFAAGEGVRLPAWVRPAPVIDDERGLALRQAITAGLRAAGLEGTVGLVDSGDVHEPPRFDRDDPGRWTLEISFGTAGFRAADRGDVEAGLLLLVDVGLALRATLPTLDLGVWLIAATSALAVRGGPAG